MKQASTHLIFFVFFWGPTFVLVPGFSLVNLGKWTEYPSFSTFGDEVEDFEELRPEMETSDRDLSLWEYGVGG